MSLTLKVEEGGSVDYELDLEDEDGQPIAAAAVATLTASLYDKDTDEVINNRDDQPVLNANGGTLHATSGHFTLSLLAADNTIADATKSREEHILLLRLVLTNGKSRNWERKVRVTNLHRVP